MHPLHPEPRQVRREQRGRRRRSAQHFCRHRKRAGVETGRLQELHRRGHLKLDLQKAQVEDPFQRQQALRFGSSFNIAAKRRREAEEAGGRNGRHRRHTGPAGRLQAPRPEQPGGGGVHGEHVQLPVRLPPSQLQQGALPARRGHAADEPDAAREEDFEEQRAEGDGLRDAGRGGGEQLRQVRGNIRTAHIVPPLHAPAQKEQEDRVDGEGPRGAHRQHHGQHAAEPEGVGEGAGGGQVPGERPREAGKADGLVREVLGEGEGGGGGAGEEQGAAAGAERGRGGADGGGQLHQAVGLRPVHAAEPRLRHGRRQLQRGRGEGAGGEVVGSEGGVGEGGEEGHAGVHAAVRRHEQQSRKRPQAEDNRVGGKILTFFIRFLFGF